MTDGGGSAHGRDRERVLESDGGRALLRALSERGGEATPAELGEATGQAPSTRAKWLARLRETGLVDGPKTRPRLTAAGWATIERAPALATSQLELSQAIAIWPTAAHQACARLMIAGVIARHHLGHAVAANHPAFVLTGRTGTGKTELARFVCAVFGLDTAAAVVPLRTATSGEILGRRVQTEGGVWRFDPSPLLRRPLVVFDEFDKAEPDGQRDALVCLQGEYEIEKEGTRVQLCAMPIVTSNKDRNGRTPLPAYIRRRSVVLDTDPLVDELDNLDLRLRALREAGGPPRLELAALRPPGPHLPETAYRLLRGLLRQALTSDGWPQANLPAIEQLALGYTPLIDGPIEAAVIVAVRDYLTCAETVDETNAGWQRRVNVTARAIGDGADVDDALELGATDQLAIEAAQRGRVTVRAAQDDDLTFRRAAFVGELEAALQDIDGRKLPREHKPVGRGVRAVLLKLRDEAGDTRSLEALADTEARAEAPRREAQAIVDALEAGRRAAAERVTERQRNEETSRQSAAFAKAHRKLTQQAAREERARLHGVWRGRRTQLGRLVPYVSEDELLKALGSLGLLRSRAAMPADFGGGISGRLTALAAGKVWLRRDDGRVVHDGAACWQEAYDQADAEVVRHGGKSRPKQVAGGRSAGRGRAA